MFGIGLPELILIMGLALIVVGPDKLPGLAKTVAKQILELKKAANSLKESLDEELSEEKESLREIAAPLGELDIRLPDFKKASSDYVVADLEDPVVDSAGAPAVEPVVEDEEEAKPDTVVEHDKL